MSNAEYRTLNAIFYLMKTSLVAVSFAFCRYWKLSVGRWALDVDRVRRSLLRGSLFTIAYFMIASTAPAQVDETPVQVDEAPTSATGKMIVAIPFRSRAAPSR